MATKFSPCKGSYVLNQFPSNVMFGMNGFHLSASGAIQGHHGPLVFGLFPDIPSVTNIYCCFFLSNHASQSIQSWYGALAKGPTHFLPKSRPLVLYLLFYNLVYFPTFHP